MPAPSPRRRGRLGGAAPTGVVAGVLALSALVTATAAPVRAQSDLPSTSAPTTASTPGKSTATTTPTPAATYQPVTLAAGRCTTAADVAAWPIAAQIGHVLMIGVPVNASATARALVQRYTLGGILLRGVPSKASGPAIRGIRDARPGFAAIVAVDEEGGRVQHLRTAVGILPSARAQALLDPADVRAKVAAHARAMRALGFTMTFGPDVDLWDGSPGPTGSNGIGDRAYSADPAVVVRYGGAFVDGMLDGGIVPVLKHFPGHGHASGDSHRRGPLTPPWETLRTTDLVPFAELTATRGSRIGVMAGHLWVPGLEDRPASLSNAAITKVLRGQLGFDGLVVTDSLSMWPIRTQFNAAAAAEQALRAGADLLVYDDSPVIDPIVIGMIKAIDDDPALAKALVRANLRVLRASGVSVCAGAIESVGTSTSTTTPRTTTTAG